LFSSDIASVEGIKKFGYPDKNNKPDRMNFGGIYRFMKPAKSTGLKLVLSGYDFKKQKIVDAEGGLAIVNDNEEVASLWTYKKLMNHWKKKHAKAVYIPSMRRGKEYQYHYGNTVHVCEGTDFDRFLTAIQNETVYIDPAVKVEKISTPTPQIKRRNQIRVNFKDISSLYHSKKEVDLMTL